MASAPSAPSLSGATKLGDLYDAVDTLKNQAVNLYTEHEGDATAYALATLSGDISTLASQIESTYSQIGAALTNLEG